MELRKLGKTDLMVSEVSMGTWSTFDKKGTDGVGYVAELMEAAISAGVNLFDTAPRYGMAERNLGRALPRLAAKNLPDPLIATKVARSSRAGAQDEIKEIRVRLGRMPDILQVHNLQGWREVLPALIALKSEGMIKAVGVSHYDPLAFNEIERAMRTGKVDLIQIPYNLMERQAEKRLLPLAQEMDIGVLVMTPITPLYQRGKITNHLADLPYNELAAFGVQDAGGLCLKYLLSKNPQVVLLPATSKQERAKSNAAVSGTPPLPPEWIERLEKIFA